MTEEWVELTSINDSDQLRKRTNTIYISPKELFSCNRVNFFMFITTVIGFISLLAYAVINASHCDLGDHSCSRKLRLKIVLVPFIAWILSIIIAIMKGIYMCYKFINC